MSAQNNTTPEAQKTRKWLKDLFSFSAVMIGFFIFFAALYIGYKATVKDKEKFLQEIAPKGIEKIGAEPLLELEYTGDYVESGQRYLEGRIKNITSKKIEYVYVNITWNDASGQFLRTVTSDAYTENLPPGEVYSFKIGCEDDPRMAQFIVDFQTKFAESIPYLDSRK
jgi:hypothetical protein